MERIKFLFYFEIETKSEKLTPLFEWYTIIDNYLPQQRGTPLQNKVFLSFYT